MPKKKKWIGPKNYAKGPFWICKDCGYLFNTLRRKFCRRCGHAKKGREELWENKP